ncbi:MAG: hypothetical protein WAV25_02190 [Minisyncoccia bacterium]
MKKNTGLTHRTTTEGFTLFISLTITATLLLVAAGIVTVALRQSFLTSSSRESQYAFYAADSGIECALYWDVKNSTGFSAFATSSPDATNISCNADAANTVGKTNPFPSSFGGPAASNISTFNLTFLDKPYCADVTVTKNSNGTTQIISNGFNTCDTSNPRRTQRSVKVTY